MNTAELIIMPPRSQDDAPESAIPTSQRKAVSTAAWVLLALLAAWGATTANSILTPAALIIPPVIAVLLWRSGEPPVLLFACVMQWLQAAVLVFYANYFGFSLVAAFGGTQLELATWLSLAGVLVLAVGMRFALLRVSTKHGSEIAAEARQVRVETVFVGYLVSFAVAIAADSLAGKAASISQFFLCFTAIKWAFVFMLGCAVLEQRRGYGLLIFCTLSEFCFGLLGFFAGFKNVFFVLAVVVFTSARAFERKRLAIMAGVCLILLVTGSAWSAVKGEYREFLNEGYVTQEVLAPIGERINKLEKLIADFDWPQMVQGFETLILRTGYVEFFARTIGNVPEKIPYERGALWGGALKHVITPRIFFPNKPALDDSERTTLYTGIEVAGAEQGTSIGIGYFGESYIDFGPVGMFAPIFLLGVFYGLIYRCFVVRARYKLIGSALASSILIFGAYNIETSNVKIIGGNVAVLLVLTVFYRALAKPLMVALRTGSQNVSD